MPDVSGGPVVTNARAFYTTRAAAGASSSGISCALDFLWAREFCKTRTHRVARTRRCVVSSPRRQATQYSRALSMEATGRCILDARRRGHDEEVRPADGRLL